MRPLAIDDWLDLGGADSFLRSGLPRTCCVTCAEVAGASRIMSICTA
jgi:hypothetical protein